MINLKNEKQAWDKVSYRLHDRARCRVPLQPQYRAWDPVGEQVRDQIWRQVHDQVWGRIWNKLMEFK